MPLFPNKTNANLCNLACANINRSKHQEASLESKKKLMDFRLLFSFQVQKKGFFRKFDVCVLSLVSILKKEMNEYFI